MATTATRMATTATGALAAAALLALLVGAADAAAFKLPELKRCSKADLRAKNDCLLDAVRDALPKMRNGLPKLGVPPLDPMVIEQFTLSQGGKGAVNMVLTFKDFTTAGVLDGIKVLMAEVDLDAMTVKAAVEVPRAVVTSNYTADGRVLVMPIKGAGGCKIQLDDISARFIIKGVREVRNGKEFVDFDSASISLVPKKMKIKMDNLFNGDRVLGDNMNRVLNDNWELIYAELSGSLNQAYGELINHYARGVFRRVSIDELFPDTLP